MIGDLFIYFLTGAFIFKSAAKNRVLWRDISLWLQAGINTENAASPTTNVSK